MWCGRKDSSITISANPTKDEFPTTAELDLLRRPENVKQHLLPKSWKTQTTFVHMSFHCQVRSPTYDSSNWQYLNTVSHQQKIVETNGLIPASLTATWTSTTTTTRKNLRRRRRSQGACIESRPQFLRCQRPSLMSSGRREQRRCYIIYPNLNVNGLWRKTSYWAAFTLFFARKKIHQVRYQMIFKCICLQFERSFHLWTQKWKK